MIAPWLIDVCIKEEAPWEMRQNCCTHFVGYSSSARGSLLSRKACSGSLPVSSNDMWGMFLYLKWVTQRIAGATTLQALRFVSKSQNTHTHSRISAGWELSSSPEMMMPFSFTLPVKLQDTSTVVILKKAVRITKKEGGGVENNWRWQRQLFSCRLPSCHKRKSYKARSVLVQKQN